MKRKIFTSIFTIAFCLIASVKLYAQDKSWHVIVMDQNENEISSFNTENSEILAPVNGKVDIINNWNNQNKKFSYDVATTLFKYELRNHGSATGTESIAAEKWTVSYFGGNLHFSQPVKYVGVYNFSGALISRQVGYGIDFSANLSPGNYVVATDKGAVKINVNGNLSGGAEAKVQTKSANYADPHVMLRSGTVSTYSGDDAPYYWNIKDGNDIVSVDVNQVKVFSFGSELLLLIQYKNGTITNVQQYGGGAFNSEAQIDYWDMVLSAKLGGASFGVNDGFPYGDWATKFVAVFTKTEILIYDVKGKKEMSFPRTFIPDMYARVSMFWAHGALVPGFSFYDTSMYNPSISFMELNSSNIFGGITAINYENKTNVIKSTFSIEEDGGIKVSFDNDFYIFKRK